MSSFAFNSASYTQAGLFDMDSLPIPTAPRRLFTALFPDASACAAIDAERQRWPGQPRRLHPIPERMHITLQFFNQVDAPHERDWLVALQDLRFEPFEIVLTQAELWHAPSGIIAVLTPELTPELAALHLATARFARQIGLPAATQGWKPHLTTLRRADKLSLQPLTQAIRWQAAHIDLIWSELKSQPPRYHRLGRFGAGRSPG
ncbi:2'-5' RNA ligase family protein [Ottowia sp. VDI28]|uniref:2'-5' RNA ligase family protein n=1 Tax=Ottowia sp. VDI28 TaxID=3133968 RepID=UPI003C2F9DD7